MTATEASRSFAALLDDAERGETIVVTRGGRRIATIGPASAANGAAVLALRADAEVDGGFVADVRAGRDSVALEAPAWPDDWSSTPVSSSLRSASAKQRVTSSTPSTTS